MEETQDKDVEGEPNAELTTKEPTTRELITKKEGTLTEKDLENH